MISLTKSLLIGTFLVFVASIRFQNQFLTFNTSTSKYVVSTSIATNFDKQFSVYCPILINTKDSTARFSPSQSKKKLLIEPRFVQDQQILYNDFHDGQYWYGFKKQVDPQRIDASATFALNRLTVGQLTYNYLIPLFTLPLTFLNLNSLYKCDQVLISYQNTENLIDVTIFSQKQYWRLSPEASWGFRNKEESINFSRQTYPLGTRIKIDVGANKYCILNDQLPKNTYNLVQKQIFTLSNLLRKYSKSLQLVEKQANEQL